VHAWLRAHFEATIVQDASRVLAATPGITEGVLQRVPDVADKFVDVANAFDPADFSGPAAPAHEGMVISYVGAFQVSINPRVFLAALRDASDADAGFARDVCARFVGPIDPDTEAAVAGLGLETVVERTGFVSHAEAVAAMRSSDVLLFVLGRDEGLKLATGSKLPEYLGARRTVLALVPDDGIAADIVRRSGAGPVVPPDDVAAVSDALLDLHRRWLAGDLPHPSEDVVAGFDRDAIVRRLDTLLEAVAKEGRRG
jgi:glycosyltransferase involved in cell wall biosynthesis